MITVESSANPVYSNVSGDNTKKQMRQDNRQTRRSTRKAKRLKKVRLRSGKTANVYVLTKLVPKGKMGFDGDYSYVDDPVSTLTQSTDFVKTNPDGTTTVIKKEDVVKSSTGAFYDKNEVAKVYAVDKSVVTQPMIDRITVAVTPTGDNPTSTEEQKTVNSDLGIVVEDKNVTLDANGQPVLVVDVKGGDNLTDEQKAKLAQEQSDADKKQRTKKILIYGGIALVVVVAGVILYRRMSRGAKQ